MDEKFAEIQAKHPGEFACRLGCHSCCKSGLTVNALEAAAIAQFLAERPELVRELRELEKANPHKGKRCAFLDAKGACAVYEVRPMVCRSHGAPLQFRPLDSRDEELRARDVCPLNFKTTDLSKIDSASVLNLDTINTLLALLSRRAFLGDESRTPLTVAALLRE